MATALAEEIARSGQKWSHAFVLALTGELGSGKTAFAQGFAKGLGVKESVLSPTFVLMREHPLKNNTFKKFIHIDCYRLEDPKELEMLGWNKLVADPANLMLIEWADRIFNLLPARYLAFLFHHTNETTRTITISETKKA